jgi:hypothetical protein
MGFIMALEAYGPVGSGKELVLSIGWAPLGPSIRLAARLGERTPCRRRIYSMALCYRSGALCSLVATWVVSEAFTRPL